MCQKPFFKKLARKLCRKLECRANNDHKNSHFNYDEYRAATNNLNPPTTMASCNATQGHSPTKSEVKKFNQALLHENKCLKIVFKKAKNRLTTLLVDKKDLLHRLRLETKTSIKLIDSIHNEAKDVMKRAQDILSKAERCKKETELMVDRSKKETELLINEIESDRAALVNQRRDLKKRSASLKKTAASMIATHKRRKIALAQQRKENQQIIDDEKEHWNMTIRVAEKKMRSSLKKLQEERVMWQVLSQGAELRVDAMTNEIHCHKSNGRKLVQMQVEKAIQREHKLKSYMSKLQSIHLALLLKERKAKRVAILIKALEEGCN